MLERSSIGVLGVLAAGLALAALAGQSKPTAAAPSAAPSRPVQAPSASTLRALRDGERIAVNAARAQDFELLPGIGPKLAERIVEQRDAGGPFRTCEDLLEVRGIGARTLERLRPLLDCGASRRTPAAPHATPRAQSSKNQIADAEIAK